MLVVECRNFLKIGRCFPFAFVHGGTAAEHQAFRRDIAFQLAVHVIAHPAGIGNHANLRVGDFPFVEHGFSGRFHAFLHHNQHPLLAFAEQDFPGLHIGLAQRNLVQPHIHARAALGAHFAGGTGDAGSAHVLDAHHSSGGNQLHGRFEDKLFPEGIAHLHAGQVVGCVFADILGCESRSVDAVFAGCRTEDIHRIARPVGCGAYGFAHFHQAYAHRVDEDIGFVAVVEIHFTTDGRNAECIAVITDAFHHAFEEPLGAFSFDIAEAQRIELCNRTGAHGEHIAVDAAHAGGCTLVWFDGAGVVMAFDLEAAGQSVADIHQSGIFFTGLGEQFAAVAGKGFQPGDGVFVAAVLAPHHGIHTQFIEVGGPAQDFPDFVKFFGQ